MTRGLLAKTIVAVSACVLLAACSSSKPKASTSSSPPSSTASAAFSVVPGMDAATIASHIPGCTGVQADSTGNGGKTLSSAAHCTLNGQTVIVDSWTETGSSRDIDQLAEKPTYYAAGATWDVFTGDPGVDAAKSVLQMQLTNADGLLDVPESQTPASLDAQKTIADLAANALGGVAYRVH
jgi:hypothetical protein